MVDGDIVQHDTLAGGGILIGSVVKIDKCYEDHNLHKRLHLCSRIMTSQVFNNLAEVYFFKVLKLHLRVLGHLSVQIFFLFPKASHRYSGPEDSSFKLKKELHGTSSIHLHTNLQNNYASHNS